MTNPCAPVSRDTGCCDARASCLESPGEYIKPMTEVDGMQISGGCTPEVSGWAMDGGGSGVGWL